MMKAKFWVFVGFLVVVVLALLSHFGSFEFKYSPKAAEPEKVTVATLTPITLEAGKPIEQVKIFWANGKNIQDGVNEWLRETRVIVKSRHLSNSSSGATAIMIVYEAKE